MTRVINRDTEESMPFMYMITSDGMANSFISETEFHKNCYGYFEAIKEHGAEQVEKQLVDWLSETSKMGCGDDISAVIAYYAAEYLFQPQRQAVFSKKGILSAFL